MDKSEILNLIEHITMLSTAEELIEEFNSIVFNITNAQGLFVYELSKHRLYSGSMVYQNVALDLLDFDSIPIIVEEIISMRICMEDKKRIFVSSEESSQIQYYYPIVNSNETSHIIKICFPLGENEIDSDTDHLISVFSNQLLLLNSKDRDFLTGLFNRQYFNKLVNSMCKPRIKKWFKSEADCMFTHFAMMDIDNFKIVNDTYGHLIGDEVLIHFSNLINEIFRREDYKIRFGGEEFCIILKKVDNSEAFEILERFRRKVEKHSFPRIGNMTISIGYSEIESSTDPFSVCDKADKALYYGKKHGRNQIFSYTKLCLENKIKSDEKDSDVTLWH